MKKFLLLTAVAVIGMSAKAQEFRFGPKAGFAMSTLKIDQNQDDLGKRNMDPKYTFTLVVWQNIRSMITSVFKQKFYTHH